MHTRCWPVSAVRHFMLDLQSVRGRRSDHVNSRPVSGCARNVRVAGQERHFEGFRERDVHSIVGREVLAKFPDARQEHVVWVPQQGICRKSSRAVWPRASDTSPLATCLRNTCATSTSSRCGACRRGDSPGLRKIRTSISAPFGVWSTHSIAAEASITITGRRAPHVRPGLRAPSA